MRPPNGILCDARSHIIHMEAGGLASLSGGLEQTVLPRNGLYLAVEDIQRNVVLSDSTDACACPTRIIHLENPLGGIVMPLSEMRRIKRFADAHGRRPNLAGSCRWSRELPRVLRRGSQRQRVSDEGDRSLCRGNSPRRQGFHEAREMGAQKHRRYNAPARMGGFCGMGRNGQRFRLRSEWGRKLIEEDSQSSAELGEPLATTWRHTLGAATDKYGVAGSK